MFPHKHVLSVLLLVWQVIVIKSQPSYYMIKYILCMIVKNVLKGNRYHEYRSENSNNEAEFGISVAILYARQTL